MANDSYYITCVLFYRAAWPQFSLELIFHPQFGFQSKPNNQNKNLIMFAFDKMARQNCYPINVMSVVGCIIIKIIYYKHIQQLGEHG